MKARKMSAILLAAICLAYPLSACGADETSTADRSSSKSRREQAKEEERAKHEEEEADSADDESSEDTTETTAETTIVTTETTAAPLPAVTNLVPETGDTLKIIGWTDSDLSYMIEQFTGDHPEYSGKVEYINVGYIGSEAREMYATYLAGGQDVDLMMAEADWLLDYADSDEYTQSIYNLGFSSSDFASCYKYTLQVGMNANNDLRGVTWQACPGCYCYRTDLAKEYLGVSTPDEMQMMTKDWDTFTSTAAVLAENSIKMVNSIGGMWTAWKYQHPDFRYSYDYNDSSDFMTLANNFRNNGYAKTMDQWYDTWYDNMQSDSVMGEFLCSWCLVDDGVLSDMEGNDYDRVYDTIYEGATYGLFNICEGPTAFAWGGCYLLLSANCDNGEIAHDFIYDFVINSETMKEYALARGNDDFVNNVGVNNSLANLTNPLLGGQSQFAVLDAMASKIPTQ